MAIVADFTANPFLGAAPLTVDFTNLSTGGATGWDWTFGDGVGYSSLENPSYTYQYGGAYTVRLNAYDATSSDMEMKYDYIWTGMTVGFEAIPLGGDPPINILMDNTGAGAMEWQWEIYKDIPDDNYGSYTPYIDTTEESFTYNFTENGVYSVRLTGFSYFMWWWPYVTASEFQYFSVGVIADFTSNVRGLIPAGTQVDFQDLSLSNPTSWLWDFGDGTTSTLQNPSHTYSVENGSMDVTLTAFKGDQSDETTSESYIRLSNMNWTTIVDEWDWRIFYQMVVFNDDLYLATNKFNEPKIRKSTNDGSTWETVLDATGYSLVVKNDTMYISTADSTYGGMYTSTDGTNWDRTNLTFNFL